MYFKTHSYTSFIIYTTQEYFNNNKNRITRLLELHQNHICHPFKTVIEVFQFYNLVYLLSFTELSV